MLSVSSFSKINSYVPGEIMFPNRQNSMLRERNHSIHDMVVFSLGLWNISQQIRGIQLRTINCHITTFFHHST